MSNLLVINSSLRSQGANSTALTENFLQQWRLQHPRDQIVQRDMATDPIPHLDEAMVGAFFTPADQRTDAQQALVKRSDDLVRELQEADVLVLGVPMYNFGIPSTLKAWIDHVARAGLTFTYTEQGPKGLLEGKTAYILAARGGRYQGTPMDTQSAYLRDVLGFIGITDVHFVYAEGLNMGEESFSEGVSGADSQINALLA
ncbi:FMN-dependent NADH-azoreductase [Aestuariirhabdus litorea]|uniref:FMN dependent NADH:quinone oxidoreductase n=1 Tax=Aestuariirhabdus litorea TaxID=2528527 RepID=A0A3P3VLA4_9GAMM|nr:FMN-dependent NADH-azoreductase [Aestuariirhabdus litorea]RRJ83184.1 FMN-dependent NADH-azoreductase [Aestuariirhabdus litorea]RWW93341.1 FMN-dependent NADH-azoreductase [Endozoicomonadaceae bacterium GTF-13]